MSEGIAVTGIGVLSPVGIGRDAYWTALSEGVSGFRPITLFDTSPYPLKIAGEITDFDPLQFLDKKGLRTLDRSTRLVCSAARLALDDAGFTINEDNCDMVGVSVGSTFGSLHSVSQFDREGLTEGPRYVNPSLFPNTVINSPASNISIRFGIKGFNSTISTGFCASLDAVIYASDLIRLGRARAVLAGGVEELCEETFMMFNALGQLAEDPSGEPVCCPYDKRRNGFIFSEGAALLVLEDKGQAEARNARVLAAVSGYGNAFEHVVSGMVGTGKALKYALSIAMEQASLDERGIDCICGCANSTGALDRMEAEVMHDMFGDHVPITAVKSMIGESYSASGALTLCAGIGILNSGYIFPTVNVHDEKMEPGIDRVQGAGRRADVNTVLVVTCDPNGNSSALILKKR